MRMFFLLTLIIGVMTAAAQGGAPTDTGLSPSERVLEAMDEIRIPEIDFRQADIRDVVTFLHEASLQYDPQKRGISMMFKLDDYGAQTVEQAGTDFFQTPTNVPSQASEVLVTFSALDITLKEALTYSCDIAGMKYVIRGGAIMIMDYGTVLDEDIIHREYDIDPLRFSEQFPSNTTMVGNLYVHSLTQLKALFKELGGEWPSKSYIHYFNGAEKLVIANTEPNIDIFETILSDLNIRRHQIEIEVHFVAFDTETISALGANGITLEALTDLRNQGRGELLAAPRAITRSGFSTVIKGVTEYIYPSDFTIVTPTTNTNSTASVSLVEPSDYCTREVGAYLDVTAEAQPNGNLIDLSILPELVEPPVWHAFGGQDNDPQGKPKQKDIRQPHFQNYKGTFNVLVASGKTLLLGGGVPSHNREQLVYMFLTARLVGMQGERLWEY
jgi:type II secretory pathway component GspD/PulD (secretin)